MGCLVKLLWQAKRLWMDWWRVFLAGCWRNGMEWEEFFELFFFLDGEEGGGEELEKERPFASSWLAVDEGEGLIDVVDGWMDD